MGNKNTGVDAAGKVCGKHLSVIYVAPPTGDWNDHVALHGLEDAKSRLLEESRVVKIADIKDTGGRGTPLATSLWEGRGLLGLGMKALDELQGHTIPQYDYPAVLSHIATALGGKVQCRGVTPSFFFIRIGSSQTGKTSSDQTLLRLIWPHTCHMDGKKVTNTFYGPTDFASGPALLRTVESKPCCLIQIDEITYVFSGASSELLAGKKHAILELVTMRGGRKEITYADLRNNILIEGAVLNVTGNATDLIFREFKPEDLRDGSLARYDFFCYEGAALKRRGIISDSKAAEEFVSNLIKLYKQERPEGRYSLTDADSAVEVGFTDDACKRMQEFSDDTIDAQNSETKDELKPIISRQYESAIKYALVHAGATRESKDIFEPVTLHDVEYGIEIAKAQVEWKMKVLLANLSAGDFDTLCLLFVEGAKSAMKRGEKPTINAIGNRRPKIKNLPPRELKDVIEICKERGLIRVTENGSKSIYEPLVEED